MSKNKVCRKCGDVMSGRTGRIIGGAAAAIILIASLAGCSSSEINNAAEETSSAAVSSVSAAEENSTVEETVSKDETSSETGETEGAASEEESKTESEKEVKEETANNVYKVGETLDTGKMKVTFQSAEDYVSDNMFIEPEEGNKYIRAYFIMENTGSSDALVSSYDFGCYADDSAADIPLLSDKLLSSATLSPGRKAEGYVYFEVPQNAQKIEIEYETSYWTQNKAIFVVK